MRNHILLLGFAVAASPYVVSAQICSIPGPHETPKCSYLIANPECWIDLENVAEALVAPPSIRLKPGAEIWIGVPKQAGQSISLDPKYADVPSPDAVAAILERIAPSIPSIAIGSSINFGDDNKSLAISGLAQLGVASRTVAMDFIRRLEAAERQLRELVDTLQTIEAQQKELADQLRSRKDSLEKSVKALQDTAKARDRVQFETAKKKFIDTAGCREAAGKEPTCDALAPLLTDRATKAAFAKFLEELPDRPERLAAIVAALDAIVEDSANHDSVDDLNAFLQADVVPRARRLRQVATSLVQLEAKSLDRVAANEELIAHTITNLSAAQALLRTGVSASWFITPEFGYCEKLPGSQTPSTLWNPGLNRRAEVTVSGTDGLSGKKTALTTVKLAWAASRWEMSVGALISTLADRSFANTTLIENGMPVPRVVDDMTDETTITNQTRITERTTVPSAVPMFFTHYRLADGLAGAHRFGVMTAVGIGVNPSTGTADFSTGLSFTIGRFAITPLAHFGRDERLTNGLKVGQDLGVSAPALSTEKFWTTRFAIGLSYLIPIKSRPRRPPSDPAHRLGGGSVTIPPMSMLKSLLLAALVALPLLAADLPYAHVENWAQLPEGYTPGAGMAVAVDGDGNIWYYNRGSHPVIQFSPDGKVLKAWKEDTKLSGHATSAHGMGVGPDGGVWLVGRENNRIYKFSPEGRVLLTIGGFSGMQGDNSAKYAFDRPAGVAHDSDGNAYVADGYRNTRVAKYGPTGEYVTHWGGKGEANGEFNLVHGVATDPQDRIYVADRGNKRIQVFDADGKFLNMWDGFGTPWALDWDEKEGVLWVCDGDNGRVLKFTQKGKLLGGFSSDGPAPGQLHQVHGIAVGADGAIYVAETVNQRIQKFVEK